MKFVEPEPPSPLKVRLFADPRPVFRPAKRSICCDDRFKRWVVEQALQAGFGHLGAADVQPLQSVKTRYCWQVGITDAARTEAEMFQFGSVRLNQVAEPAASHLSIAERDGVELGI